MGGCVAERGGGVGFGMSMVRSWEWVVEMVPSAAMVRSWRWPEFVAAARVFGEAGVAQVMLGSGMAV